MMAEKPLNLSQTQLEWLDKPGRYADIRNRTFQALLRKGAIEVVETYSWEGKAEIKTTAAGDKAIAKWRRGRDSNSGSPKASAG